LAILQELKVGLFCAEKWSKDYSVGQVCCEIPSVGCDVILGTQALFTLTDFMS